MEQKKTKIAVIGGGAAGLSAAAACARRFGRGSVLILERQARTGRKLLATGNGRCNLTNRFVSPERYHGDSRLIHSVLDSFSVEQMVEFMRSLGVLLREESEGRIYPHSNQASTVLDALRGECERLGAEELCGIGINTIKKEKGRFLIRSEQITVEADRVIAATGSMASPHLGANSGGYDLLGSMGLKTSPLFAALSPVCTKEARKSLKGVRAKGSVTLLADGKPVKQTTGEIQFTDNGLSGICVFELSRAVNEFFLLKTVEGTPTGRIQLSADVMTETSFAQLCDYLTACQKLFSGRKTTELLSGALHKHLAAAIALQCGLQDRDCASLNRQEIKKLAHSAKHLLFTPVPSDAFRSAQVSAGGFGAKEIDPATMMSRKVEGLYVCGELLDVDGDCGGFNLHFAVGSALLAARHISR